MPWMSATPSHAQHSFSIAAAAAAVAYPFLSYAVTYWMHYALLASSKSSSSSRVEDIFARDTEFLESGQSSIHSAWSMQFSFSYLNSTWTQRSYTALHVACRGGILPLVKLFLSRGDNKDERDTSGNTALHHAAWKGHDDV